MCQVSDFQKAFYLRVCVERSFRGGGKKVFQPTTIEEITPDNRWNLRDFLKC